MVIIDLITIWAISNEYFIYKPMNEDENSDCYHITNLKKENATMLLPDFLKDPECKISFYVSYLFYILGKNLAYHDGILYTTNKEKIYVISCKDTLQKGEIKKLPYKKQTVAAF